MILARLLQMLAVIGLAWGAMAPPAAAQSDPPAAPVRLPAWVVPALRLVSATHVEPTTGVVLSDTGLVLVPLAFGAPDDEIVVLDGGTDIVRNGRPARLHRTFADLGLKVLAVTGLNRPGARLSAEALADGGQVTLAAFPPAERIEEGAPPLRETAALRASLRSGSTASDLAPAAPLPNVTGALLDACDRLAGYSIADGVQTVAPAAGTRYVWQHALQTVLDELGLESAALPCVPDETNETGAPREEPAAALPGDDVEREPAASAPEPSAVEPPVETPPAAPAGADLPPTLPPLEHGLPTPLPTAPAAATDTAGGSGWWLAAAVLLIATGLGIHRLRARPAVSAGPSGIDGEAAEDDVPAAGPVTDDDAVFGDGRLVLRGQYADGRPLRVGAPMQTGAIALEIGRGDADLALDSPAVSRRHARLAGTAGMLTLADLGSSNGSSINGVPCLEGEIMFVGPGDTVILGDVRFVIEFEPGRAAP